MRPTTFQFSLTMPGREVTSLGSKEGDGNEL